MSFARAFKCLLALAVVFAASLSSQPTMAMAAKSPMNHAETGRTMHCPDMAEGRSDAPKHDRDQAGKSCCAAACPGIAAMASDTVDAIARNGQKPLRAGVKSIHGVISEIATPPPRNA